MTSSIIIYSCVCWTFFAFIYECSGGRSIVDLTYNYDRKYTPSHPASAKFDLRVLKKGFMDSGKWYYENDIFMGEHLGTHIDAPIHIKADSESVDQISPYKLYRVPGVMIDLKRRIRGNKKYQIKPRDLEEWTEKHGRIPDGGVVLLRTGWGDKALDPKVYRGVDADGRTNFPGLSEAASDWIVSYKNNSEEMMGIVGVGIDTLSIDDGNDYYSLPSHRTLLENGVFVLENVANMQQLPPRHFTLTILPLKIHGGSGAPARIFAEIEGIPYASPQTSSSTVITLPSSHFVCVIILHLWKTAFS